MPQNKKLLRAWTQDREELIYGLNDSDKFHITNRNRLIAFNPFGNSLEDFLEKGEKSIQSFSLPILAHHHTTDYLRFAFQELYPDKDFDREFETDKPGVIARIEELGYRDKLEEKVAELRLRHLLEELEKRGYDLELK